MTHLLLTLIIIATFCHTLIAQVQSGKDPGAKKENFITEKVEVKGLVLKPFTITPENINKLNFTVYEQKNVKVTGASM